MGAAVLSRGSQDVVPAQRAVARPGELLGTRGSDSEVRRKGRESAFRQALRASGMLTDAGTARRVSAAEHQGPRAQPWKAPATGSEKPTALTSSRGLPYSRYSKPVSSQRGSEESLQCVPKAHIAVARCWCLGCLATDVSLFRQV